jgi:hypothetical protein
MSQNPSRIQVHPRFARDSRLIGRVAPLTDRRSLISHHRSPIPSDLASISRGDPADGLALSDRSRINLFPVCPRDINARLKISPVTTGMTNSTTLEVEDPPAPGVDVEALNRDRM